MAQNNQNVKQLKVNIIAIKKWNKNRNATNLMQMITKTAKTTMTRKSVDTRHIYHNPKRTACHDVFLTCGFEKRRELIQK